MKFDPTHFVEVFQRWVRERPDHPAIVFLERFEGADRGPALTYAELDERVRPLARGLVREGLAGSRVLLLHPPGAEFAVALLACLHAGVVAVPAPPPDAGGRGAARLAGIVDDAGIGCVLAGTSVAPTVRSWLGDAGLVHRVACVVEADLVGGAQDVELPAPDPSAVAFLQYTSGSTSEPKGVVVTHRALAHNQLEIARALRMSPDSRVLSWLPHYHDMGLVGQLLGPLFNGGTSYGMAPMTFLKRPYRWLQMISELRADITAAPDFAYALATRRVTDEQLAELDLSCLRTALNGSEPIHAATLDRFVERFAPAGLRHDAMVPSYGMAETTLMITCTPVGRGHLTRDVDAGALEANRIEPGQPGRPARRLVSSGRAVDLDVRVVDPVTEAELPDGTVGEIWISGESVAAGYWRRPELTAQVFHARVPGFPGDCLRTGDLGALVGGELFVTGRIKEMLVLNGRNLYPQDIERTIRAAHPLAAAGVTAVFTIEDAGSANAAALTVAVQEVRPGDMRNVAADEMVAALRAHVRAEHDVHLGDVVFVPIGSVARTTSGKIQRGVMRAEYLAGALRALPATAGAR